MSGGWGILQAGGLRQRGRPTNGWESDLRNYVHNLANKSLQMDSSGNVDVSGVINIATAGGLFQGTGTFASPTTGLKIYSDGTNGLVELWDASAKAFSLTHTKFLFGSNVAAAATTALAVFAENATYNSESLGAGDILMGDNSTNRANLLWDNSAGKLQLRGGTTMQCEIGTDGKLYAGGGNVLLDVDGIALLAGTTTSNRVNWTSSGSLISFVAGNRTGAVPNGSVQTVKSFTLASGETCLTDLIADGGDTQAELALYAVQGTAASSYATLVINSTALWKATPSGLFINDDANAQMSMGLTLNQGASDNEILALKSSDVGHAIINEAEADTYGTGSKASATLGGLALTGYSTTTYALQLVGKIDADDTTKSTAGTGAVMIIGRTKGGANSGDMGANANILAVLQGASTTRFILDADGDSHQDVGTAWTNYDSYDDVALLTQLSVAVSRDQDPIKQQFQDFLNANRVRLEEAKLVTFNEDGHHFVNMSKLAMLLVGAVRQCAAKIDILERHVGLLKEGV